MSINRDAPNQSTFASDLHLTYEQIKTGFWDISTTYNAPSVEGYNGGAFLWIPTGKEDNKNYGFVIVTALTSTYQMKYFIAARWYTTWGEWHEI